MSELLTPSILAPTSSYALRAILAALGIGLVGAGMVVAGSPGATDGVPLPLVIDLLAAEPSLGTEPAAITMPDDPTPTAAPVHLVFTAGGATYMALTDLRSRSTGDEGLTLPTHGVPALVTTTDGDPEAAVARVRDTAVTEAMRGWRGRTVQVIGADGGAGCLATVGDYAIVSRLIGDPSYVGEDSSEWTAALMFDTGHRVLAVRLDLPQAAGLEPTATCVSGVRGIVARDAVLPAMQPLAATALESTTDPLVGLARAALIASPAGSATAAAWAEQEGTGAWSTDEGTHFRVWVVPHRNQEFVVVHARSNFACGWPSVNALGIYRHVDGHRLVPVTETLLEELSEIDGFADLDRDGKPELLGRGDLGLDAVVAGANGEILQKLPLPFFGCPC